MLQIRSAGGQQSPYYAELEAAQSNAESSGLGLWSKVQGYPCFHAICLKPFCLIHNHRSPMNAFLT